MSGSHDNDGSYPSYWNAIQERVCSVCLDQGPDGECGLKHRTCAIRTFLPTLVAAVAPIESDRMNEYFTAVEAQICTDCEHHREAPLECALRKRGECALYAYLPFVVDALQAAAEETRAGQAEGPGTSGTTAVVEAGPWE